MQGPLEERSATGKHMQCSVVVMRLGTLDWIGLN
jgi:hypothetical protein